MGGQKKNGGRGGGLLGAREQGKGKRGVGEWGGGGGGEQTVEDGVSGARE